jgi:type I restriction enzyme S subunit
MTTLGERVGGPKRIVGGPFGSNLTSADYVLKGVPVIRGSNMEQNGRWIGGEFAFVSAEKAASDLRSNIAYRGDIIVTQRGTMGQVSIVPDDAPAEQFVISQSQMAISVDESYASRDFVYYYLRSPQFVEYLTQSIIQTGVPHINLGILRQVPAEWPELAVQQLIASPLTILDDKIELNRRMNETLEGLAQAIFRDWFVDFGPVRRKLAGATDPVAIMGGLTPDPARAAQLAALFPDALGDDELPMGWCAGDLGGLATTAGESVDPTRLSDDIPYIGLEHMPRRSIMLDNWDFSGKVSSQKSRFSRGQVLFGKLRPYFHKVGIAPIDGVCSTDIVVLDSLAEFDRELVACCASSDAFVAFTDMSSTGTKMPRTSWSHMRSFEMTIPDESVRRGFSALVRPMHEKILSSVAESRTLAETRDYLLPRLMSGEVRVGDAAQEIAA